jgi:hypothetical protein
MSSVVVLLHGLKIPDSVAKLPNNMEYTSMLTKLKNNIPLM